MTARPHEKIRRALPVPTVDLLLDEPEREHDLRVYIERRAIALAEGRAVPATARLLQAVAERSDGNFLMAERLLDAAEGVEGETQLDAAAQELPEALRGELLMKVGLEPAAWKQDAPAFGVLAVARASLDDAELASIVGWPRSRVNDALDRWASYLVVDQGSVRLFHHALQRFMLSDSIFGLYPDEAHAAIVRFLLDDSASTWPAGERRYGLEHMAPHLLGGLLAARDRQSLQFFAETAGSLLGDPEFLTAVFLRGGGPTVIETLVNGARQLAAISKVPGVEADIVAAMTRGVSFSQVSVSPHASELASGAAAMIGAVGAMLIEAYAKAYRRIRGSELAGAQRTATMTAVVNEVRRLAEYGVLRGAGLDRLMAGDEGERIVALAIMKAYPDPASFPAVCEAVGSSRTAFEQFHALDVISRMLPLLSGKDREHLLGVLDAERRDVRKLGVMDDTNRGERIIALISRLLDEREDSA